MYMCICTLLLDEILFYCMHIMMYVYVYIFKYIYIYIYINKHILPCIQYGHIPIRDFPLHSTPAHAPPLAAPLQAAAAWREVGRGGIPYGYISNLDNGHTGYWIYNHIWVCWAQINAPSRPQPRIMGCKNISFW